MTKLLEEHVAGLSLVALPGCVARLALHCRLLVCADWMPDKTNIRSAYQNSANVADKLHILPICYDIYIFRFVSFMHQFMMNSAVLGHQFVDNWIKKLVTFFVIVT